MKRRVLSLFLIAVLVLSVVGCGSPTTKKETLKVGMEIGYPPFEYYDADGTTVIGVDVELAKALGEKMGMEIEFVDTAWEGIFSGLDKGDYDCITSAVTITPDRLLDYDFSDSYIKNYQCIVTLKTATVKPTKPEELAGLKVGYQEETTSDIFLTDMIDNNKVKCETSEYPKVLDVFNDLQIGRLDAVLCDSTVASSYLGDGSLFKQTWIQDSAPEEFGVCIKKGNSALTTKINSALAELKKDGTLDKILAKYF
ncbi:transporter substrate-binding domain-containing protein [[Clostridium] fimetarium]|uniref:Polar amino acid transport system substrate-binding protein n=1 Tax=[Clostridium] fimetarium TaxID=99656 RepID=A0A1I0RN04_9FIRM|nr:transporter substrate-binding domain-containing protein [[Clostridium] fimetarium]SEW42581.1 polar amino acid transport system substrate-binding protein [[Clostridium] fimetarium]